MAAISWSLVTYQEELRRSVPGKIKLTLCASATCLFWRAAMVASRVVAIGSFAAIYVSVLCVCVCGYLNLPPPPPLLPSVVSMCVLKRSHLTSFILFFFFFSPQPLTPMEHLATPLLTLIILHQHHNTYLHTTISQYHYNLLYNTTDTHTTPTTLSLLTTCTTTSSSRHQRG